MSKSKPILMNTLMVRAILAGDKTQTRRLIPWQITANMDTPRGPEDYAAGYPFAADQDGDYRPVKDFARYQPGDTLWVRETYYEPGYSYQTYPGDDEWRGWARQELAWYAVDGVPPVLAENDWNVPEGFYPDRSFHPACKDYSWRKKPSIHMPKWAARLFLEVTAVRVERLQDISVEDCIAEGIDTAETPCSVRRDGLHSDAWYDGEGCEACGAPSMPDLFRTLWDSTTTKPGTRWADNPWVFVYEFQKCEKPEGWPNLTEVM